LTVLCFKNGKQYPIVVSNPLPNFHYPKSFIKGLDDSRQLPLESSQQRLLPAIANSHPKQFSRVALSVGKMQKILVLAHDDPVAGNGVIPDLEVECFVHVQVEDVAGFVSTRVQKPAKGYREMVVH